jgi:hypothetical protein
MVDMLTPAIDTVEDEAFDVIEMPGIVRMTGSSAAPHFCA